jgi:hypothetical protein
MYDKCPCNIGGSYLRIHSNPLWTPPENTCSKQLVLSRMKHSLDKQQAFSVSLLSCGADIVTQMLQVAAHMRRQGYFVVAALTRPFDFEGRRKLEEADALVEALAEVAQLTVVVPQAVLVRASSELTVKDASAIADTTLEFSMRAILWALGAPELLIAAAGRGVMCPFC